jgi:hypothetical protein
MICSRDRKREACITVVQSVRIGRANKRSIQFHPKTNSDNHHHGLMKGIQPSCRAWRPSRKRAKLKPTMDCVKRFELFWRLVRSTIAGFRPSPMAIVALGGERGRSASIYQNHLKSNSRAIQQV